MKHSIKRTPIVLVLFLSVLLCTTVLLVSCGDGSDKLTYDLTKDGTGYIVTGCDDENASKITIPAEHEGLPVVAIGDSAFSYMRHLSTVTLPDTIETIGDSAFLGCGLKKIALPTGLKELGHKAFGACTKLKTVTVPDTLEVLGTEAFVGCSKLSEFTIPSSLHTMGARVFERTNITGETVTGVTYYGNWVIGAQEPPSIVTLRDGTVGVCGSAFYGNTTLEKIYLGSDLLYIGASAFKGCTNLKDCQIESPLKKIEEYAFYDCTSLASVTLPGSLEYVGAIPFSGTENEPVACVFAGTVERWAEISVDAQRNAPEGMSSGSIGYTVECTNGKYNERVKLETDN